MRAECQVRTSGRRAALKKDMASSPNQRYYLYPTPHTYYIITENIITPNQHGFMPGSTTVDCVVDLVEEISTTLDHGDYAVTIFLDILLI